MDPSRFRIVTTLDILLKVASMDKNRTILFIDFVFYEPSRRLLYSRPMPSYKTHGLLFWGAEFIAQAPQWYTAKHTFFVYFRHDGRHFGYGIPTLKHRERDHCVSLSKLSILGQLHHSPARWCSATQFLARVNKQLLALYLRNQASRWRPSNRPSWHWTAVTSNTT